MQRTAIRRLSYLLPATEAISNNECVLARSTHCREQHSLPHLHRHLVVIFLKPKGSSHATTACIGHLEVKPQLLQDGFFIPHLHNSFMVTMTMHNSFLSS